MWIATGGRPFVRSTWLMIQRQKRFFSLSSASGDDMMYVGDCLCNAVDLFPISNVYG